MKIFKNKAFTLAEVLITLGIIGVVAAMTIPTLITYTQKKETIAKLQRAISVINQASKLSFDENGDPEDAFGMGAKAYFNQYWEPYLKILKYCNTYSDCNYSEITPFKYSNGSKDTTVVVSNSSRVTFQTMDGFLYIIFTAGGSENGDVAINQIYVDINGGTKPNVYGKDVFMLERLEEGKGVQPYCLNNTDGQVNVGCSMRPGSGRCCAEKIRRAGWKIDSTYPWK
mgnify:CR=1 FL=1